MNDEFVWMWNEGLFGKAIIFLLAAFALVVVVWVAGFAAWTVGFHTPVQESTYTGHAYDLDYEGGLVMQTTEVYFKTHPRSSQSESFCILDAPTNPMTDKLREAARNKSEVTVTHHTPLYVPPWDCMTVPVIQSIEVK